MKRLDSIYSQLPEWLQDFAVTLKGARYYKQRYGGFFAEEYALLKATEMASPLQLELLQVGRLKRILAHAAATVPHYQERLNKKSWESVRAGDWSAFSGLPVTEKATLRSNPSKFLSGGRPDRNWIEWNTSGTTGSPMQLYYQPDAVSRQYAYVERYREQAGVSRFLRRAQFTGKMIVTGERPKRLWRYDWANRALLLSSVHLNSETIPKYLDALERFEPAYLSGYPSAIYLLAQHALRYRKRTLRIPAILTSAETLGEEQRETIETAFSGKVFDQYGQTEMQSFWFECRYRRMHAHPLFGVTEIVTQDGRPCRPGEVGDVLLTGLINRAMPLIRYRVGDRAAWADSERCPCGRNMPMIESIEGRLEDYLFSKQRGWVGRMDPAIKGVEGVVECQLLQEVPDSIRVLCVPAPEFKTESRLKLESNLRSRLGSEMRIDFQIVDQIPRGANGKFRAVISQLTQEVEKRADQVEVRQG
jgi:phenylacetate-CoA ligase